MRKIKSKANSSRKYSQTKKKDEDTDIIQLILKHHRPLKALIKIMKRKTATYSQKKTAFVEFAPMLVAHAKPEEQSWYKFMKSQKDTKVEGLEGDVEHGLADQLCEELKATNNNDMFMAKVKILAELVEHHIEEEEEEMLPHFKRETKQNVRIVLGEEYTKIRETFLDLDMDNSPSIKSPAISTKEAHLNLKSS